ncbi:MAG: hypothetical protein JEY97_11290 [Bacteroidales bacterium]|nr:hypothetical protein [Bacteroidales bacterium]
MKRNILIIFMFFVLIINDNLYSQSLKSFSNDSETYLAELETLFGNIPNKTRKKQADELLEKFSKTWNSIIFTKSFKDTVCHTSSRMLKRKMSAFPYFYEYLTALINISNSNQSPESINAWQFSLESLLDKQNKKHFLSYIEGCNILFSKQIIYKSKSLEWKVTNKYFYFDFDTIPMIVFPEINLKCVTKKDSSFISETKGAFLPSINKWMGEGGKVFWERASFHTDSVYAELNTYSINCKSSVFSADSVKFHNKYFFDRPLLGTINEKISSGGLSGIPSYPRFTSYLNQYHIKNLFDGIDFEGGFSMRGAKLIAWGIKDDKAKLFFKKDDKIFAAFTSMNFVIYNNTINSIKSSASFYLENDSIFHPELKIKYSDTDKSLYLHKDKKGLSKSPFLDSYHKLNIFCEALNWNTNDSIMSFEMMKGINKKSVALFESNNFYSENEYINLQGIDENNPIEEITKYIEPVDEKEFNISFFANYLNKPVDQIKAILVKLANKGFIVYDSEDEKVYIKENLIDYYNAYQGKIDYDVIRIKSIINSGSNAGLNVDNYNLTVKGVPEIQLSDSQNVYIYPEKQEITFRKNRDFIFSGKIHAGLFDFYSKNGLFEYDKFKLALPTIDSMSFTVRSNYDKVNNFYRQIIIKTVIADISGELVIDDPNNKSGSKSFPEYPYFTNKNDAYVYFDNKSIQNGVYNREKFKYHVYPFTIDSLDNFTTEGLKMDGNLASGGIFPVIEEPLTIQADYSLGFIHETPDEGYPIYNGKGTFYSKIFLSNEGLKGNGLLEYLTSETRSDNFIFLPDSANSLAQNFIIENQISPVEYPRVEGDNIQQHWLPFSDSMQINSNDEKLLMYDNQVNFAGELIYTAKRLFGSGNLEFADALMSSDLFNFHNHAFDSDTTDFTLRKAESSQITLSTLDYKAYVDFDDRIGRFSNVGLNSIVEFPFNKYICYMDEFDWLMDNDEIILRNNISNSYPDLNQMRYDRIMCIDLPGSQFISTNPLHDSLAFFCIKAKYDIKNYIISAEDVKIIKVADAAIFPGNETITILKDAKMQTINEAVIIADTVNKNHFIYDAEVNIASKKMFSAKGYYDYVGKDGRRQAIYMNNITVNSTGETFANGFITDSSNFFLNSGFLFSGMAKLRAKNKFLGFEGGYRIIQDCYITHNYWIKFSSTIDPKNIFLPVDKDLKDITGQKMFASLLFSKDEFKIYPAFLSPKGFYSDIEIISANGMINYDEVAEKYTIADSSRFNQSSLTGNLLSLDTKKCIITGEGKINFGLDLGAVSCETYGKTQHFIIPDSTEFELLMILEFFFDSKALEIFADEIDLANLKGVNLNKPIFLNSLNQILGQKKAEKLTEEISLYGAYQKVPDQLLKTLVFSNVNFKWNNNSKSYISKGKIGIGNIQKTQINKLIKGDFEIVKKRSGDSFSIYLEIDEKHWYFFDYKNNILQAISSNRDFNNILRNTKPENQEYKSPDGKHVYKFIISTKRKLVDFKRKMQAYSEY